MLNYIIFLYKIKLMNYENKLNNLIRLRKERKLTQTDVAKQMNVSTSTYSYWELGRNDIPLQTLYSLSEFFNVPIDYILGNDINAKMPLNKDRVTILGYGIGKKEIELTEEQKQLLTSLIDQFEKSNKK